MSPSAYGGRWCLRCFVLVFMLLAAAPAAARCGTPGTPLARIALGDGDVAQPGAEVTVEATVSAAFLGKERLNGFYVADETAAGDPVGLFVYAPELDIEQAAAVERGAVLRLSGQVGRYQGQRQLERLEALTRCGSAEAMEPIDLRLPAQRERLQRLDGLPVRFEQTLTVTDNHDLARYGSLLLSAGGRLFADDGDVAPRQIVLDDGSHETRPNPPPYLNARGTRRIGSQVRGLTGVLASTFGAFRIHPTTSPDWVEANPRRDLAQRPEGALRVALFNVQNYFARLGRRGAESETQRARQQAQLAAAIARLDADVLGLLEVGNSKAAVRTLVAAINEAVDSPAQYRPVLGTDPVGEDAIRGVLLYRHNRVQLMGPARAVSPPVYERPLIMARFSDEALASFGVVLGHFKSKGGCPDGQRSPDPITGCWHQRRVHQSEALLEALDSSSEITPRWLVLADLNAYAHERPVSVLREGGLDDLLAKGMPPRQRYTYVYKGRSGTLDYALATPGLTEDVESVRVWHINADEPPFIGYRGAVRDRSRPAGPYRSSDHDPVVVDLLGTGFTED